MGKITKQIFKGHVIPIMSLNLDFTIYFYIVKL